MTRPTTSSLLLLSTLIHCTGALQLTPGSGLPKNDIVSRRKAVSIPAAGFLTIATGTVIPSNAATPNGLPLTKTPSGLRWADAKVGTGQPLTAGAMASIDYSMASTAGRFPQIYTTKDKGAPYRWKLGDGTTIAGIEMAILGDGEGMPPMLPGGIRRVIVPSTLGFEALAAPNSQCIAGKEGSIGPIPPKDEGLGAYQRWYQFYCNPRIPYQPDLVLDIKLYGKR